MPNNEEILAANEALRVDLVAHKESVDELTRRISRAEGRGDLTRWMAYCLIAVFLVAGFGFLYERTAYNRNLINTRYEFDLTACNHSNSSRVGQREQWEDIRILLYNQSSTPKTLRLADGLVANAHKNFPDLDCELVKMGKSPTAKPATKPSTSPSVSPVPPVVNP